MLDSNKILPHEVIIMIEKTMERTITVKANVFRADGTLKSTETITTILSEGNCDPGTFGHIDKGV